MGKRVLCLIVLSFVVSLSVPAFATNGDNLIAIGPISRAMGGVGIAAPQDAISAVFSNPAAMCFGPYCPSSEVNFGGTLFMPHTDAKITAGGQTFKADSDEKVYAIPAMGISVPITDKYPFWRFGLAAYGVTGLGVDYRDTSLDQPGYFFGGAAPLAAGEFTELQIFKFAPAIAAQPLENLSLGLALHIDYANLDLRNGSSANYAFGVQAGAIYRIMDDLSVGLNFVSPQKVNHKNVLAGDFDLELESPLQIGAGIAYTLFGGKLLLETDVKWLNWSDAAGYGDFDWNDQWVFALGAQYKVTNQIVLRAGYNYGENPVEEHNNWRGFDPIKVQGITFPKYYYESFRIIGFPAIVEHHITAGVGYEINSRFALNLGYMHAFENSISERGTDLTGQNPARFESTLSEDSIDLGLTWRF